MYVTYKDIIKDILALAIKGCIIRSQSVTYAKHIVLLDKRNNLSIKFIKK